MKPRAVLALDIGAGSGRGILGYRASDGGLERVEEVHRFENGFVRLNGGLYWDYVRIYRGALDCLRACRARGVELDSIGVDAWSQDYAYIGAGGEVLGLPRCYRDPVNEAHARDFERDFRLGPLDHARSSGAGFISISTLRQLWYDRTHRKDLFKAARRYLYIPYLLVYLLTGVAGYDDSLPAIGEQCDARTLRYSDETARVLGVLDKTPPRLQWGTLVGRTNDTVLQETDYDAVPMACVDGHDTASAVSAIPDDGSFLWVSSGSYNMFGAVLEQPALNDELLSLGFVNTRLGDGRVCLMGGGAGMHFIQQCMRRWREEGREITYPQLTGYALAHRTARRFDFADVPGAAADMPAALNAAIERAGHAPAHSPHALYEAFANSLAQLTAEGLTRLEGLLNRKFPRVYVVSGGAQANAVNQRLAEALARPLLAGLPEAATMGNIRAQLTALGAGLAKTSIEMRRFGL
ncbi:FGGY-family carbohydrate kinase [Bacillota bacterium Meth-B3]